MTSYTRSVFIVACGAAVVSAGVMLWNRMPMRSGDGRRELLLYCGAGIRPGASAVIEAFTAKTGIKVVPTYEGSGQALGKIAAGAGGDLFMPGSEFYVDKAMAKGLVLRESKRTVAYFIPVLLVQKGNPKGIRTLSDLKKSGVRVGLGDERSAAVGQTTLELLKKNHIQYDELLHNVVYKSGTVDELGVAIQMRTVDVVILWDVNAKHFKSCGEVIPIPPEQNVVSLIPAVVLTSSKNSKAAMEFIEFAASSEGKKIMSEHGFTVDYPDDRR